MKHGHHTAYFNQLWGSAFVEALLFNGVTQFVVSPGSRSTPLTDAVARHPKTKKTIVYDERGAAFYALGFARATGTPAALICTSGTAAANYLPAIIEASVDCQPLIVLTADRPPELRQTGANQTIVQPGIYGSHVRWQFDFPCPADDLPEQIVHTGVAQAVHFASRPPAGPVHLNCMFREPFFDDSDAAIPSAKTVLQTRYPNSMPVVAQSDVAEIAEGICDAPQALIIAGRGITAAAAPAISALAARWELPVAADIQSRLRLGNTAGHVLHYFDQLLLSDVFRQQFRPQAVLQFGLPPVSKRIGEWLKEIQPQMYALVAETPFRYDPNHQVTHRLETDSAHFCRQLDTCLSARKRDANPFISFLSATSQLVDRVVAQHIDIPAEAINEISAARLVSQHIKPGWHLFLGSSMPIRDMDMYATASGISARVAANRGASGIDGTIATACGFAEGMASPAVLLLGDLTLLHDLNSLHLVQQAQQPLIVVVINNRGGGIFSFLPVATQSDHFEKYFATPHSLTFEHSARQFGLAYSQPVINADFSAVFDAWQQTQTRGIIEIASDRTQNVEHHRDLQQNIRDRVNEFISGVIS